MARMTASNESRFGFAGAELRGTDSGVLCVPDLRIESSDIEWLSFLT